MREAQKDSGLITVERAVAFVLTPIVVAASGTLSAAAVKWGFNVSPEVIEGAFATGGLMAGAAAWKWLHGRQLWERGRVEIAKIEPALAELGVTRGQSFDPIPPAADPAPASQVDEQGAEQADLGAASGS